MSSGSSSAYSRTIVSAVSPAASIPRTCSTAIRMSPDDRLPPEDVRPHGDAIERFRFAAHGSPLTRAGQRRADQPFEAPSVVLDVTLFPPNSESDRHFPHVARSDVDQRRPNLFNA